uniref:Uncharacterized protein n=1 Tax=Ananas comosus var. bracteatus TaxID=296719 RepID=A0A6V7QYM6_ANACO
MLSSTFYVQYGCENSALRHLLFCAKTKVLKAHASKFGISQIKSFKFDDGDGQLNLSLDMSSAEGCVKMQIFSNSGVVSVVTQKPSFMISLTELIASAFSGWSEPTWFRRAFRNQE